MVADGDIDLGVGVISVDMPKEEKDKLWDDYIASMKVSEDTEENSD